jgi:phospholipid/cholesterol/gamma-HCH transport system substrate-binding protein
METRANYVLIGVFTLAVIAGGFLFVMWFTGLGKSAQHKTYEVVFTGSVSGLSRGSLVTFNGLRVGEVRSIGFFPNDPTRVAAMIDVTENAPVKSDTQARLESQGLTGVATLALTGESSSSPALHPGPGGAPPIIDAERSDFQNLLETVQRISGKADAALTKANKLIDDNSPAVSDALHNVDQFSKALAENSAGVKTFLASVSDLGQKLAPLSDKLQTLSSDVDVVVKAVDPGKVKDFIANVDDFSAALARNKSNVDSILADAAGLAKRLNGTSQKLDNSLDQVADLAKAFDRGKIAGAVDDVASFTQTLKQNRGNLDRMFKDASELAAKLDNSADQVDGLLHGLQGLVGSPEAKGAIGELGDAARSVRLLADNLDTRTKEISVGLTRFSASGLREYEALAVDGRRTVNDLDRLLRSLSNNPSQVIFGAKSTLPEYHGGQ